MIPCISSSRFSKFHTTLLMYLHLNSGPDLVILLANLTNPSDTSKVGTISLSVFKNRVPKVITDFFKAT